MIRATGPTGPTGPTGTSQRQLRVGETIRRALSDLLLRGELHEPELARMSITVGEVRVTPDLRNATVFVMPLGGANRDAALAGLRRAKAQIRRAVTQAVNLKFSPDLTFAIDETFDRMDETRRMFSDEKVRRDLEGKDGDAEEDGA